MLNCSLVLCCVRGEKINKKYSKIIIKNGKKSNNTQYKNGFHGYIFMLLEKIYCYFNDGSILFDVEFLYNLENEIKLKHLIDSNSNIQLLKLKILVRSASIIFILSALCFCNFNLLFFKRYFTFDKNKSKMRATNWLNV